MKLFSILSLTTKRQSTLSIPAEINLFFRALSPRVSDCACTGRLKVHNPIAWHCDQQHALRELTPLKLQTGYLGVLSDMLVSK